eukprot:355506-Amphidinium_carterae.1
MATKRHSSLSCSRLMEGTKLVTAHPGESPTIACHWTLWWAAALSGCYLPQCSDVESGSEDRSCHVTTLLCELQFACTRHKHGKTAKSQCQTESLITSWLLATIKT